MRRAWVGVLPLLLSGCFVPPTVAVASYAADGASYAATGKSVTDHGVSTVKNEDCATYRVFVGGTVCKDPNHPAPAAPLVQHGGVPAAAAQPEAAQLIVAPPVVHFFSVGTFSDRRRAELYARRFADYKPQLLPTSIAGRDLVRVILGPLDDQEMARLHERGVGGYEVSTPVPAVPAVAQSPKPAPPG